MDIDILIDKEFKNKPPVEEWFKKVVFTALTAEQADPSTQVSLFITGQEKVHQLNLEYLGEDRPTDVLSFPMLAPEESGRTFVTPPDSMVHLGEVIISYPQAAIQAEEHGHPVEREMAVLIIHGILHLLGYDHDVPEAEGKMKEREKAILEILGNLK
jgi:probable rRNA maturation factor